MRDKKNWIKDIIQEMQIQEFADSYHKKDSKAKLDSWIDIIGGILKASKEYRYEYLNNHTDELYAIMEEMESMRDHYNE